MSEFKVGDKVTHAYGEEKDHWFNDAPNEIGTVVAFNEDDVYPVLVNWPSRDSENYPHLLREVVRV